MILSCAGTGQCFRNESRRFIFPGETRARTCALQGPSRQQTLPPTDPLTLRLYQLFCGGSGSWRYASNITFADSGGDMVACSNPACPNGVYFHATCMAPDIHDDEDWYCSPSCADTLASPYCVCATRKDEPKVECSNKEACQGQQYYHMSCIGLDCIPADDDDDGKTSVIATQE